MHILFTLKAAGSFWLHSSKLTKNTMVSEVYSKRGKKKVPTEATPGGRDMHCWEHAAQLVLNPSTLQLSHSLTLTLVSNVSIF